MLLRDEKLEAVGDSVRSRGTDRILPSIWSHRSYYLDVQNGDVLQINSAGPADWHDLWVKRWRAVMLKKPQLPTLFHVKPTTSDVIPPATTVHASVQPDHKLTAVQASIKQAIKVLWSGEIPTGVTVKTRDQQIIKWQRDNGLAVASPKTIHRYLKRKN